MEDFHIYRSSNHKVRDSFQNFFWILYNKHLINLNSQAIQKSSDQKSQAIRQSFKQINLNTQKSQIRARFWRFSWYVYISIIKSQSMWQFSKFLLDSLQQALDKFKYPKKSSDPTVLLEDFTKRSSNHKVRDSFQNFFWILYNKHLINLNTQKSQAIRLSFIGLFIYRSSNHKVRDSFQNFFWILYNKHLINLNTQKSQAIRLSFKIYQKLEDFDGMFTYRSSNHKVCDSFQNFFWILYNKHLINLNIIKVKRSDCPSRFIKSLEDFTQKMIRLLVYIWSVITKYVTVFKIFWILYNKHLINLNTQKSQAIRLSFKILPKAWRFWWHKFYPKNQAIRSSNHKVCDSFQNFFWILYNKHLINLNTQKSQAIRLSFKIYQKLEDFDGMFTYRSSNHKVCDSFQNFFWILYNKHLINLNTQKSQAIRLSFKIFKILMACLHIDHITKYVTVFKISFGFFTTSTWYI